MRKLASIQEIISIEPIEGADRIVCPGNPAEQIETYRSGVVCVHNPSGR